MTCEKMELLDGIGIFERTELELIASWQSCGCVVCTEALAEWRESNAP